MPYNLLITGGEERIRTSDGVAPITVFETEARLHAKWLKRKPHGAYSRKHGQLFSINKRFAAVKRADSGIDATAGGV
jgi:hypothetical protein